ncbi:MAG: zf-HC2 domain-containing protein [Chloroflexota bacterium]
MQHPHAELSAYIDDALDPAAQAAVDGHLVACAVCQAHVAELRATAALMRALPDPVPSRSLLPRLATAPAWLAPLRTLMTLASGAAVFLFIASALITNITFLAGSAAAPAALDASRNTAASAPEAQAGGAAASGAPAPASTPFAAFQPTASSTPSLDLTRSPQSAATADNAQKRADQASPSPSEAGRVAVATGENAGVASQAPQRSPLVNPWLWLAVAIVCAALAIALHRRLRTV